MNDSAGTTINIGIVATDEASEAIQATTDSVGDLNAAVADASPDIAAMNDSLVETSGTAADTSDVMDRLAISAAEGGSALRDAGIAADEGAGGFSLFSGSMLKSLAPLAALFIGFEGVKAVFEDAKTETDQLAAANVQIANTLKNTNDAVGMTVTQIDKLAESTAKGTDFTKAANTTIAEQFVALQGMNSTTMPQAIKLTDDLATKMAVMKGKAVPSLQQTSMAAKAMAKALQDPTTATAAFTRAGVTLTSTEIAQIKAIAANTNATITQARSINGVTAAGAKALSNWSDLTSAQQTAAETADNITSAEITQAKAFGTANAQTSAQQQLMSDLAKQVSGAATAAAQTFSGKVIALKNALAEELIPALKDLEHSLEDFGSIILDVTEWLNKHRVVLAGIAGIMGGALLVAMYDIVGAIYAQIMGLIMMAPLWLAANASMIIFIAAAAAVAIAAYEIITHWKDVKQWFDDFMAFIKVTWDAIKHIFDDAINFIKTHWELIGAILLAPIMPVLLAFVLFRKQITDIFKDIVKDITDIVSGFGTLLYDAGKDLITGFIKGIEDSVKDVVKTVEDVGKDAVSALKSVLKIFSPSQVFAEIGANVGAGLVQGIKGSQNSVSQASAQLGASTVGGAIGVPALNTSAAPSIATTTNVTNNSPSSNASVNIQQLNLQLPNGATMQTFMNSLNQDTLSASKGLSMAQGVTTI